jgi:hypothetical protein
MTKFILTILINCIILSVVFNLKVFNLKYGTKETK